jgi:hypothetical protein
MVFSKILRWIGVLIWLASFILILIWPTLATGGHLSFVILYALIISMYLICWARALEEDYPLFSPTYAFATLLAMIGVAICHILMQPYLSFAVILPYAVVLYILERRSKRQFNET